MRLESFPGADVAQLVERELPKLEVAGSRPVVRFAWIEASSGPQWGKTQSGMGMQVTTQDLGRA